MGSPNSRPNRSYRDSTRLGCSAPGLGRRTRGQRQHRELDQARPITLSAAIWCASSTAFAIVARQSGHGCARGKRGAATAATPSHRRRPRSFEYSSNDHGDAHGASGAGPAWFMFPTPILARASSLRVGRNFIGGLPSRWWQIRIVSCGWAGFRVSRHPMHSLPLRVANRSLGLKSITCHLVSCSCRHWLARNRRLCYRPGTANPCCCRMRRPSCDRMNVAKSWACGDAPLMTVKRSACCDRQRVRQRDDLLAGILRSRPPHWCNR